MKYSIKDKKVIIYGFGAQGRSQAYNVKDSGLNISVCLPKSSSNIEDVKAAEIDLITDPKEAARAADILVFLVPDAVQKDLYNEIVDHIRPNSAIVFAHGLNIHYKLIEPREDLDIVLVAPMSQGGAVRSMYLEKVSLPTLIAVSQNVTNYAWKIAETYATALGATEKTLLKSTFKEETETDLFSEQALTVGGLWGLITAAFDTLVEEGYSPETAYYCCLKEVQILSEVFARLGVVGTFQNISDAARFGALSRGPRIIDKHVRDKMKKVLEEIKDGKFIKELSEDFSKGEKSDTFNLMKIMSEHQLEVLHRKLNSNGSSGQARG